MSNKSLSSTADKVDVIVRVSERPKCPRCWQYSGIPMNYECLCDGCQEIILQDFPEHESVPGILVALEAQRVRWNLPPEWKLIKQKEKENE